jgi:hypothetical protein
MDGESYRETMMTRENLSPAARAGRNPISGRKLRQFPSVIFAAAMCLASPARAEVITLICGAPDTPSVANITIDVDLDERTVSYPDGNPPRTVRAEITSRTVSWSSPYFAGWMHRIDRRSQLFYTYSAQSGTWTAGLNGDNTCKRLDGDLLRR